MYTTLLLADTAKVVCIQSGGKCNGEISADWWKLVHNQDLVSIYHVVIVNIVVLKSKSIIILLHSPYLFSYSYRHL